MKKIVLVTLSLMGSLYCAHIDFSPGKKTDIAAKRLAMMKQQYSQKKKQLVSLERSITKLSQDSAHFPLISSRISLLTKDIAELAQNIGIVETSLHALSS